MEMHRVAGGQQLGRTRFHFVGRSMFDVANPLEVVLGAAGSTSVTMITHEVLDRREPRT